MKPSGDAPLSIPQSSPLASYLSRKQEIEAAIDKVLRSGRYILGEEVAAFEHELARYLEVKHAIGVGSGTDALYLALRACGVGDGDLVVTVSHTAVATVAAIEMCGAHPVFVDIRGDDFTMDPAMAATAADRFQGRGLKAIVPVHLYGHPADMQSILSVAKRYGLWVVEDCAQSAGATLIGKKAGSLGDI
ncbi:MAG TPA: DegT/DnrJ/EryC1/StrS family aminotransferase, partial [Syntrophobacteraceae bacterium]|nr:DegT/DnrJ/EryC1/StrS family aminotransferase [Syntrophobacteraceae bacterium]